MKRLLHPVFSSALLLTASLPGSALAQRGASPDADTPPAGEETAPFGGFNPTMPAFDRYEKMAEKSPFEFELAKAPEPPKADPFADLALAGYVGSGTRMTVFLQNLKTQERISVYGKDVPGRKNDSGFEIVRLEKGPTLRSTKVVLSRNGEEGTVGFNSDALNTMRGGAVNAAVGANPARPGQPGQPGQAGRPINLPGAPAARGGNVPGAAPAVNNPGGNAPAVNAPAQPQAFQTAQPFVPRREQQPVNNVAGGGAQQGMNGGATPTQQVEQMLENARPTPAQPSGPFNAGPGRQPAAPGANPPKRRVVLPTQ